jgi:hypothetical protein
MRATCMPCETPRPSLRCIMLQLPTTMAPMDEKGRQIKFENGRTLAALKMLVCAETCLSVGTNPHLKSTSPLCTPTFQEPKLVKTSYDRAGKWKHTELLTPLSPKIRRTTQNRSTRSGACHGICRCWFFVWNSIRVKCRKTKLQRTHLLPWLAVRQERNGSFVQHSGRVAG